MSNTSIGAGRWLGLAIAACVASVCLCTSAIARDDKKEEPKPSVVDLSLTLPGQEGAIKYRATAGYQPLLDDKGKPKAQIFNVSYIKLGDDGQPLNGEAQAKRPVTFAFNGGPGSSSVWLHLGALGPYRAQMGEGGELLSSTGAVEPNPRSWLAFTDLVFIDPVSTGYSRAAEGEDAKQFHGLDEDVRAVGEFIRLWLVRNDRWTSKKYLVGESYGTTRASALAPHLQGGLGINLEGIVLISPVLNFSTLSFDVGHDVAYPLYLPSFAATAVYHGKVTLPVGQTLPQFLKTVEAFAMNEYTLALGKGDTLTKQETDVLARKMSGFIGISPEFIKRADLRVRDGDFFKELLRDQERTIGRLDSRFKGIDRSDTGEREEYDPSYAAIQGMFTAAFNSYIRQTLNFKLDTPYEILTGAVQPWNYGRARNRYANVSDDLRSAMSQNPYLRVLAQSGYYDLATPYFAMDYTASHLGLDAARRSNLTQTYYQAGHMMYIRKADFEQFYNDVRAWYAKPPVTPDPVLPATPAGPGK